MSGAQRLDTVTAADFDTLAELNAIVTDATLDDASSPRTPTAHTHAAANVTSGTFASARISSASVTQHEAALTILESQITDGSIIARLAAAETVAGAWAFTPGATFGNIKVGVTNGNTIDTTSAELILTGAAGTRVRILDPTATREYRFFMDSSVFQISGPVATSREFARIATAGTKRWGLEGSANAETGADAGTNLRFAAADDAGALIDIPFEIKRKAGGDITLRRPVVGTSTFSGTQHISTIATGTPPLVVTSTTVVTNLNVDLLDGNEAAAFALSAHTHDAADVTSGVFADARISETSVTQHFPIADTSGLVKGSADATKIVRIEADGLTTSTTRVITMPDANLTLMGGFTTGSVVFSGSAGNPAQANSNFFWDNPAKRLGVGTPTPNAPMDVTGVTPGSVGGFQSGSFHVTSSSADVNANAVITGHNKFGGNKQLWYLGSTSSSNDNIGLINRQNGTTALYTNNTARLTAELDGIITLEKTITIKGGVPTAGKVLTSVDTTGAATWETAAASATLFGVSTATQSFTSNTTLADVTSLSVAIAANEKMHVKIVLYVSTGIGGLKLALNGPVGFTSLHYIVQPTKTTGVGTAGLHTAYNSSTGESSSTLIAMELHAIIINGGTAGNIVARAAQESSNVSSSDILRDSFISGDVIP